LINPGLFVPVFITQLTGISNSMVRAAPPPEQVFPELAAYLEGTTLVAHNASFDRRFLEHELNLAGRMTRHDFVCTLLLSRRLYPKLPNYKLATLIDAYGIRFEGRHHRALADATMTAHVFLRMLADLNKLYPDKAICPSFLVRYQKTPKAKVRANPGGTP
jgi:DNA polymerase-3 subunit epsilon